MERDHQAYLNHDERGDASSCFPPSQSAPEGWKQLTFVSCSVPKLAMQRGPLGRDKAHELQYQVKDVECFPTVFISFSCFLCLPRQRGWDISLRTALFPTMVK